MLTPAAEFEYSPRVRELFANLQHAGSLSAASAASTIMNSNAGSHEQGASIRLQIELQNDHLNMVRYQAYGCPHFLAACESLAQWLEGRPMTELSQWRWRDLEAELTVPASKRARLLVLEEALLPLQALCRLG